MMRWNHPLSLSLHLECFPSHPLYPSLPSSFPLALLCRVFYSTFSALWHMALLAAFPCSPTPCYTAICKWAPNVSTGARVSGAALECSYRHQSCRFSLVLPPHKTGMPTCSDCSWISVSVKEKDFLKVPPEVKLLVSRALFAFPHPAGILLHHSFQILHVSSQVFRTPEGFAFTFPHFLLLLKEAFNLASLLDCVWQKLEDLLKIRDNEQK